jgi:hypothetical protein
MLKAALLASEVETLHAEKQRQMKKRTTKRRYTAGGVFYLEQKGPPVHVHALADRH